MTSPPTFASLQEYVSRRGDIDFWWPYVASIVQRHGLDDSGRELEAGFNPTWPTFLFGDVVVKLFGYSRVWRRIHAAERAVLALVTTNSEIAAPSLLAEGQLYDDADAPWPYLVTSRVAGVSVQDVELSTEQWREIAVEVGKQVHRLHSLRPSGVATHEDWSGLDVTEAAKQSSLPSHLVAQVDGYITRLAPFDDVFTHGDLVKMHTFVENGHFSGIIDWGDAMVTDRHYELIQPYRDLFGCDKTLFRVFLNACEWPMGEDFPRQALGHGLYRQAVGLAQHHSMDVFEPIAEAFPLQDIATLDELATELFDI